MQDPPMTLRPKLHLSLICFIAACSRGGAIDVEPPEPLTPVEVEVPVVEQPRVTREAEPERPLPPLTALTRITYSPESARSMSEVLSVTVHVELHGSQGGHEVVANFEAPGGMPYERRAKQIDGTAFDTHQIDFVLPVAGTMIPQAGLSGVWVASLYHDGEKLAVPTFELTR
jgi:hypothetical protein